MIKKGLLLLFLWSKEKQNDLVNSLLSYMETDFPNWKDNLYYLKNF